MQVFVLFMLVAVTTFDYLLRLRLLPSIAGFIPELLGAAALIYVVAVGVRTRFKLLSPFYLLIFGAIVFVMICGVVLNSVHPGPIFTGLRNYLRAIPFFLLPAVFAFNEKQISAQLRVLILVCLVQLPLALYQKMQPGVTGDSIYGTFLISSIMSMFLICATCVLIGFYQRGYLRLPVLILLCVLFLAPATINETKGTLVLFPVAVALTFVIGAKPGMRLKNALVASGILFAFFSAFVAAYDYTQRDRRYRTSIVEFFMGDKVESYLESGKGFTTDRKDIKRMDTVKVTYGYLARDPMHLAFGLGIGNVSRSSLGLKFQGEYVPLFGGYMFLTGVRVMAEIGILGLALVYVLLIAILKDAYVIVREDKGRLGAIASGWLGVTFVMMAGMFYKDIMATNALSFLFWYFSGLIAARRMAIAHERMESRRSAMATPPLAARPGHWKLKRET